LINQAKLIGVLYLENNLTPHVFTPTRIAVLKLLASQAAISLENTRLYRDLEKREAKIRRLVDANIMGIFIWNFEGQIIDANEAFLQMVNYSHEDLISGRLNWKDLTPQEWRDLTEQAVGQLKATGTLQPYEQEYFRNDGSRHQSLTKLASRSVRSSPMRTLGFAGSPGTFPIWKRQLRQFAALVGMANEPTRYSLECELYSRRPQPRKSRSTSMRSFKKFSPSPSTNYKGIVYRFELSSLTIYLS
jgi:PAS domain S-box-containing protein